MDLSEYFRRNKFTFRDFLSLMSTIFDEMENEKVFVFPVTYDHITVEKEQDKPIKFKVQGLEEYKVAKEVEAEENKAKEYLRRPNEDAVDVAPTISEREKITPIMSFMEDVLLKDSSARYDSPIQEIMTMRIPFEIKCLMNILNKPGSLVNFKFFSLKMRELNKRAQNPRIFYFKDKFHLPNSDAPLSLSKRSAHDENEDDIVCNYCGVFNLDPMIQLDECKCTMHTECLEKAIVETIKQKEFRSTFEYNMPCATPDKHFHHLDLVLLVEIEKDGFSLAKNICKLIQYYYLNHHVSVDEKCNCTQNGHFLVDTLTKNPTMLHNARCSFCGDRYHEQCPEFLKSLSW